MPESGFTPRRRAARRAVAAGVIALAVAASGVACTAEEPPPAEGISSPPVKGGTLVLLDEAPFYDTLDPQEVYVLNQLNLSTLIYRTLVTMKVAPGAEPELTPDLATDLGRPSDDNRTWEFSLRRGLKWEDGQEITCEQVRHGVARSFDARNGAEAVVQGGPTYPRQVLDVDEDYTGPYTQPDADFGAVECADDWTVRFHLKHAVGDFPYMLTLPVFSPVRPLGVEKESAFDRSPLANGPYKIVEGKAPDPDNGQPGRLILGRNAYWDATTDPARPAYPDRIEVRYGIDREAATQRMLAGDREYDNAVFLGSNVPANFIQQVLADPALYAQALTGYTNSVRYLAINTAKVDDLSCRQALVYAFDRRKFLSVYGGTVFGDYASTMISPQSPAYREFDVYRAKDNPDGDLERARELWTEECPDRLTLDHADTPQLKRAAQTIVDTYGKLGIKVKANPIPADEYFPTIQQTGKQGDLTLAAWVADWPNGSGTIPTLYHGDSIVDGSNLNLAQLNVTEINTLIDQASQEPDLAEQYSLWGELDERIAREAPTVPISWGKAVQLMGRNVRGAVMHPQFGMAGVSALGVATVA
ncbi:ABC transporter substrate-binding protein [Phytomonospora sp. NPDC050363]|uniref:ABC transporter substrate-binding protein n=1 Tax=Phytomonospora sp. NPDC050363 TaxID=3155642 RepID=UPI0033F68550